LPSERRKEETVTDEDKTVYSIDRAFCQILLKLSVCAQIIAIEAYHVTQYFRKKTILKQRLLLQRKLFGFPLVCSSLW